MDYSTINDLDVLRDYLSQAIANQKTAQFQVSYWFTRATEEGEKIKTIKHQIKSLER